MENSNNNMSQEGFENEVINGLEQILSRMVGVATTITRDTIHKTNGPREAAIVNFSGSNVSPTVYLDDAFTRYQGGESVDTIVSEIAAKVATAYDNRPNFDVSSITAENAKQHITLAVINSEKNQELLDKTPHYDIGDVSVIPRWKVSEDATFVVSNDVTASMGLTPEEVLRLGQQNINSTEFSIKTMREAMLGILAKDGMDPEYAAALIPESDGNEIIVLTTMDGFQGAKAILSDDALNAVREKLNGQDFYILPSSVHEVLCVPDNGSMTPKDLREMVVSVNSTEVSPQDFLSDNIFRFDGNKIKMVIDDLKMDPMKGAKMVAEGINNTIINVPKPEPRKMAMKM